MQSPLDFTLGLLRKLMSLFTVVSSFRAESFKAFFTNSQRSSVPAVIILFYSLQSFAAVSPLTWEALQRMVWQNNILQAELIAKDLFSKCPPNKCVIVSLGNVNVLVDSFLRNLAKSQFDGPYLYEVPINNLTQLQAYHSNLPTLSQEILNKIVPDQSFIRGREVIILRTLMLGLTVRATLKVITDHFLDQMSPDQVGTYFITTSESDVSHRIQGLFKTLSIKGPHYVYLNDGLVEQFALNREHSVSGSNRQISGYMNPIEDYHRYEPINLKKVNGPLIFRENPKFKELDSLVFEFLLNKSRLGISGNRSDLKTPNLCNSISNP